MRIKLSYGYPPNYHHIAATLGPFPPGVIFCYGDTIYSPDGSNPSPELIAHETVHSERQGDTPEWWWANYLISPAFRLAEEIPAHQAEYHHIRTSEANRHVRRRALMLISRRLASPLYGKLISYRAAKTLVALTRPQWKGPKP